MHRYSLRLVRLKISSWLHHCEHLAMLKINQKRKLGYHGGLFDPYVGKGNSTRNWKREERKAYPSKGYRGY